ncbi:lipoate--protein ligase family protein [Candidatus Nomurabacteria bacterium]|nr:lipoate--protein ligase family protein [Candidatus Nomurabacteria bacterium]
MEGIKKSLTKKIPNGKLLRIDLTSREGHISEISLTGDFFLHPEECIVDIEKALTGKSIDVKKAEIQDIIENVLGKKQAQLMGVSPRDIAEQVREILDKKHRFRLLPMQVFDAATNMALDEAIEEAVREGESLPTIRIYTWKPDAISIGYFQGLENEVNLKNCKEQGVDIVRRRTGGGAVYHSEEGEITYSIIAPQKLFPANIIASYKEICMPLVEALELVGVKAEFSPINDISANGKKISGNAQTRRDDILLQHGTLLYSVDVDTMFSLLTVSKEKIADKFIASVKKRVTSLSDENPKVGKEEFIEKLIECYKKRFEIELGEYSEKEVQRAKELVAQRYSQQSWTAMR